jgi:hypothetical protein
MTTTMVFPDSEEAILSWVRSLAITPKVFLKTENIVPPVILLNRVGGAPTGGTVPTDEPRISFHVWGANRPQARTLTKALVNAVESLAWNPDVTTAEGVIVAGEVIGILWLPDPIKDVPRYVVESRFVVRA